MSRVRATPVQKKKEPALSVDLEREVDGRWIAEIASLPGVMAYGKTKHDAMRNVSVVAFRTIADRMESGKRIPAAIARIFEHGMEVR